MTKMNIEVGVFFFKLVFCICGVMVSVIASRAIDHGFVIASRAVDHGFVIASRVIDHGFVIASRAADHGFQPPSGQTKDNGVCCFSAKHASLRCRSKD
jgi:hypothetical protein